HCFSLMSPICGAHQPRRFGSRLMGFLLPEFYHLSNESLTPPLFYVWRQSGNSAKTRRKNLSSFLLIFTLPASKNHRFLETNE
ncbi:MAG: hypothetical protein E6736_16565, partial [Leclercia adecarboxylata]|nr:hypothetical protein [Leclercia adecarboxylata]